jgi:hypothetical protein
MDHITCINPLTSELWADFITNQPQSTVFHHPLWMTLLNQQYGYNPMAYCLINDLGNIRAGIPFLSLRRFPFNKCLVSLPFTDHCTPLYEDEKYLKELLNHLVNIQSKDGISCIEIRSSIPEIDGVTKNDGLVIHFLQLTPDPNLVFKNFKKTQVQQCIRKSEREGITIRFDRSKDGIDAFYRLHLITRKRLGVPIQPKRFFDLLWKLLIKNGMGFVLLAFIRDIPIASAVFLNYKEHVIYKYSASDPNYLELRPNNLIIWKAIEWACLNGYKLFDFGKSETTNTGLRSFKDGWGSLEKPLPYSFISSAKTKTRSSIIEPVAKNVIQKSPLFVCKIMGELLYRYFG